MGLHQTLHKTEGSPKHHLSIAQRGWMGRQKVGWWLQRQVASFGDDSKNALMLTDDSCTHLWICYKLLYCTPTHTHLGDRVSLCNLGWYQTYSYPPTPAPQVLGL